MSFNWTLDGAFKNVIMTSQIAQSVFSDNFGVNRDFYLELVPLPLDEQTMHFQHEIDLSFKTDLDNTSQKLSMTRVYLNLMSSPSIWQIDAEVQFKLFRDFRCIAKYDSEITLKRDTCVTRLDISNVCIEGMKYALKASNSVVIGIDWNVEQVFLSGSLPPQEWCDHGIGAPQNDGRDEDVLVDDEDDDVLVDDDDDDDLIS